MPGMFCLFFSFFVPNCVSPLNGEGIKNVPGSVNCSFMGYLCLERIPHNRHVIRLETTIECLTSYKYFFAENLELSAYSLKGDNS